MWPYELEVAIVFFSRLTMTEMEEEEEEEGGTAAPLF